MKERGNKLLRSLDKYVGIPLIWSLGLLHRKNLKNITYQNNSVRIVLLKTAGIGDTILLSSIVKEIKNYFQNAYITLICTKGNFSAANLLNVDQIIVFDINNPTSSLMEIHNLQRYDYLLDFAPWARLNSILSFFCKSSIKVGFKRENMHRHYLYDYVVEHSDKLHEIENYRNILRVIGLKLKLYNPTIEARQNVTHIQIPQMPYKEFIVFHAFPGGVNSFLREWPTEEWGRLGKLLINKGYNIVISGGKEDVDRAELLRREIDSQGQKCISIAGKISLKDMTGLLSRCLLLVTVQTGIMHLGAAVGTKVVALHGPTSPARWGPIGEKDKTIVVNPNVECAPCLSLGFEYACSNGYCMRTISVDQVVDSVSSLL